VTLAVSSPVAAGARHRAPWAYRLPIKFLALVGSTFLAIIIPGMWLLIGFMHDADEATLTARVGNLAARVAIAVDRHRAFDDPLLAGDLMSPLAADRAFLCAELRSGGGIAAAVPRGQGCVENPAGSTLDVPVDAEGLWTLRVGFTDTELREARRLELLLGIAGIFLAFLATLVAGGLGFRYLVWRPLHLLTTAIVRSAETGTRHTVDWNSSDEIGLVVGAFNGLVEHEARREQELTTANEHLRASQAALSTLNRDLEARVRERTRELEQAKLRAEVANDTKTRFLWSMSHELRTPLNAIIGFSEIMNQGMFGPLEHPRYLGFVRDINQSGCHLLEIINDLLDIARIEVGQETLREEPVAVAALVADCVRVVRPMADEQGLELQVGDIASDLTVLVDRTKMKQVLLNLLSNAIKNTLDGGAITVDVEPAPNAGIAFRIADTGRGIAPEDIVRVLEPFGQVDDGHQQASKGTGLGLPLARMMVELHGGRLTIQSALGVGTTVVVSLPATRVPDQASTAP